jgi:microsomal dipeptidase-like Zn-dependent dipeptidase
MTRRPSIGAGSTPRAELASLFVGGVVMLTTFGLTAPSLAADRSPPSRGDRGSLAPTGGRAIRSQFALANRCFALASVVGGRFVAATGNAAYRADRRAIGRATAFYLKPTRLGAYLLYDQDGRLMSALRSRAVGRAGAPGTSTEWAPARASARALTITATATRRQLAPGPSGRLVLAAAGEPGARRLFRFTPDRGCRRYPEARVGAAGKPFAHTNPDGTVFGFADAHLHITADMRAGGRVIHGASFARFGITRALGGDARDHGADGSQDIIGNLLRSGVPFGTHDVHGWPSFAGWPVHDTITHQQTYYVWLERVWEAGLRLVVAQTAEDQPLCRIVPRRARSCDETRTIKLEIARLRALQDYVDAQSGGPGRGWFRLVYSPAQARRVIERGKLAVLIGIESSDLFGCSEFKGKPRCTRGDVDRGIHAYRRLGVRSMFIAHWVDNAFAGAALEGGAKGAFINVLNALETGRYFQTGSCPERGQGEEVQALGLPVLRFLRQFFPAAAPVLGVPIPSYPPGRQCNARGLTALGRYLIRRLIANHMLIEVDHLSERARETVLAMAAARHYPLVSSHTGTGGEWTPSELRRLYALGGFATATPDQTPALVDKIIRFRRYRSAKHYFGVGLGTDTGGFSALPGPRAAAAAARPLRYPFTSYDGRVRFVRQRTGERSYDLNTDGVAHYGLFADLLADAEQQKHGREALRLLFRSAEAYLRTWELVVAYR